MGNYAQANQMHFDVRERKGKPVNLFPDKQLVVSLGVASGPVCMIQNIIDEAIEEARTLYDNGIRNIIIQNVKDVPMLDTGRTETVSAMTVIASSIRKAIPDDCIMGLSLLRDNGKAMVTVATCAQLDYIRPKCYVGAVVNHDGIHEGIVNDVLQTKKELMSNIEIMPDVFDRTSSPLGNFSLTECVGQAVSFGLAKCINLAGRNFDESIEMAKEVRKAFPDLKIYLGGGANKNNIKQAFDYFDGVHVASCLKDTGNMTGRFDAEKIKEFMEVYRSI